MARSSSVSGLEDHLGFWLRFVSNHASHEFERRLRAENVSVAEWVVLRELLDRETASIGELREVTGMTKGAVSKVVSRLLEKSLVTCTEAEGDRRSREARLTRAGRALTPRLAELADANDQQFFGDLAIGERIQLMKTLRKIVERHGLTKAPTD